MKRFLMYLGLSPILVGLGCSTAQIKSDFDREVNFSDLRSFDWLDMSISPGSDPYTRNTLLEKRIRNAAVKELKSKGYDNQTSGEPDFLVTYHVGIADKVSVTSYGYSYWPRYYGRFGGYYGPGRVDVRQYKEGTLILDFVDPESNQLVWRGWYVGAVKDREIGEKKIRKAVSHILEEFPPEKKKGKGYSSGY